MTKVRAFLYTNMFNTRCGPVVMSQSETRALPLKQKQTVINLTMCILMEDGFSFGLFKI